MDKQLRPRASASQANRTRRKLAEAALHDVLNQSTRPGFFGSCSVELTINDGTIQNVRRRVEKIDRVLPSKNVKCNGC
ncbi:MAG: hypothetical protein DWQ31_15615 [Planctomycetota bacterium]|nr:MAG: hypothetical protein DWQ31_15615 [Planctomycetota bacterium]REJ89974.1 MAG: hypothetical protein DWQ35_17300 [Planctomycetota bacterium]REK28207.1 MAG: hypothetical protein DWQ42_05685 [Planctomycetota bacterium]REK42465.1 MAG: hypothetical protein DWQ46_13325 [Planctomycetota bacterium]